MNPRQMETADRVTMLRDFMQRNYQYYYGILIFKPAHTFENVIDDELMRDASQMWLIKNNIEAEITL